MKIRPSMHLLALLASGCAGLNGAGAAGEPTEPTVTVQAPGGEATKAPNAVVVPAPNALSSQSRAAKKLAEAAAAVPPLEPGASARLFPGDDRLFKREVGPQVDPVLTTGDRVSLNFENVTIGNLAIALLGDLLQLNYTIDAGSETVVSLSTRQPLLRSQVLDVLDAVLLPHDLAIVRDNVGVYHVTKRAVTVGSRPVVGASRFKDLSGAGTVIVPLNYIAAGEMAKILTPIAPREAIVYVDATRNLLVLQGSKGQLGGWLEMVDAFDVDFLSGMSLGIFVLENANVNTVRDAMQVILGGGDKSSDPYAGAPSGSSGGGAGAAAAAAAAGGGSAGLVSGLIRLFPIERLNALVVVTPRSQMLSQVENWIRRLDQPTDVLEASLYVYPVQNGSAVYLAEMLNGLFSGDSASGGGGRGVAAGSAPTQFGQSSAGGLGSSGGMGGAGGLSFGNLGRATGASGGAGGAGGSSLGFSSGVGAGASGSGSSGGGSAPVSVARLEGNVRVVADSKRNALIIRAPRAEYRRIQKALRELDKAPRQVLIEASIVEVSLTGNLQYGVEWFVQNSLSNNRQGQAALNYNASGGIGARQPGFSYTILNKAGLVRATLNALAEKSQLRVLSNPSVLVLDNYSANIMIGNQQPIKSATTVSSTNLITEAITYKDTGVMLAVTPSVNAGGLITMDILQQVTDVGEIDSATGQRSFLTRQIQSRVAVRSGEPVVLGGMIRENETTGKSGIPGLSEIPGLGALFSTNSTARARTELLVLLTPRALEDDDELRAASAELRQRIRTLSLQSLPLGAQVDSPSPEPDRKAP